MAAINQTEAKKILNSLNLTEAAAVQPTPGGQHIIFCCGRDYHKCRHDLNRESCVSKTELGWTFRAQQGSVACISCNRPK